LLPPAVVVNVTLQGHEPCLKCTGENIEETRECLPGRVNSCSQNQWGGPEEAKRASRQKNCLRQGPARWTNCGPPVTDTMVADIDLRLANLPAPLPWSSCATILLCWDWLSWPAT